MVQRFVNNWSGALAVALNAGDATLELMDAAGLPTLDMPGDYFKLTLVRRIGDAEITWEIVRVTGVSGRVLTIARGEEGTLDADWELGATVELRLTADALDELAVAEEVATAAASEASTARDAAALSAQAATTAETQATASATSAGTSASNAKASEDSAALSASNAQASEIDAKASEDSAALSASKATTSAINARISELDAETSEVNAKASEINAKVSEDAAKTSQTASGTSETNAKSSEDMATALLQAFRDERAAMEARLDNLELLGSFLGSVNTLADLPATVADAVITFGRTPTANDFAFVQSDYLYPNMVLMYSIMDIAGGSIDWSAAPVLKIPLLLPNPGELPIGAVILSYSKTAPDGYVPLDGAMYSRTGDMSDLWAFAQAKSTVSTETLWAGNKTVFSSGDGVNTFRVPQVQDSDAVIFSSDNARAGVRSDGNIPAHTHTAPVYRSNGSADGAGLFGAFTDGVQRGSASTDASGSGTKNYAAGMRLAAYIKFRAVSSSGSGGGGTGGPVAFVDLIGNPTDNTALALVLADKQSTLTAAQLLGVNQSATAFAAGDGSIKIPAGTTITSGGVTLLGTDAAGTVVTVGSVPVQLPALSKLGGTSASNKILTEADVSVMRTDLTQLQGQINGVSQRYSLSFVAQGITNPASQLSGYVTSKGGTVSAGVSAKNTDDGHLWVYYTSTGWSDDGFDTVSIATTATVGVVKSATGDGQVAVAPDGAMSTIGWNTLKGVVTSLETQAAGLATALDALRLAANPQLWPANTEVDLGNGLFGQRITGTITSAASVATGYLVLATLPAGSSVLKAEGFFSISTSPSYLNTWVSMTQDGAVATMHSTEFRFNKTNGQVVWKSTAANDRTNAPYSLIIQYTKP